MGGHSGIAQCPGAINIPSPQQKDVHPFQSQSRMLPSNSRMLYLPLLYTYQDTHTETYINTHTHTDTHKHTHTLTQTHTHTQKLAMHTMILRTLPVSKHQRSGVTGLFPPPLRIPKTQSPFLHLQASSRRPSMQDLATAYPGHSYIHTFFKNNKLRNLEIQFSRGSKLKVEKTVKSS